MTVDSKDVGELQTALNVAAGKLSVLWTTFITLQFYFAIAFGSVTHRDLFLQTAIKLPILNVDLPLIGFFIVVPIVLVIFHFYVFLQLLGLARKAQDYNTLLSRYTPNELIRQRLDSFLVLQFLAGPTRHRAGFSGLSLLLIAWVTLVATPVVILIQAQISFLPYHLESVLWLQRIAIVSDLALIWHFWPYIRSRGAEFPGGIFKKLSTFVGILASICIFLFSIGIATFSGEWAYARLTHFGDALSNGSWAQTLRNAWLSLHELAFAGAPDEVNGKPKSLFSNRLVLMDQSFVDPDKLDKVEVTHSFRGRDLSQAVLDRTDLRKADFTGAMLDGARLASANLQNAHFGCGVRPSYEGPGKSCTSLRGAILTQANLKDTILSGAQLQGATLWSAQLQGADLYWADLKGADLYLSRLQGANLQDAQLHLACLANAKMQVAILFNAALPAATLAYADLRGASLSGAQLQGVNLFDVDMRGAILEKAAVWRAWSQQAGARPILDDLTDMDRIRTDGGPWEEPATPRVSLEVRQASFVAWRDSIVAEIPVARRATRCGPAPSFADAITRLSWLDPASPPRTGVIEAESWIRDNPAATPEKRAAFLADLACSDVYVARALLKRGWIKGLGPHIMVVADRFRKAKFDQTTCPIVRDLTEEYWAMLDQLIFDEFKGR
jgi:uncharacterized protein YjbI with pentapeptide repeats